MAVLVNSSSSSAGPWTVSATGMARAVSCTGGAAVPAPLSGRRSSMHLRTFAVHAVSFSLSDGEIAGKDIGRVKRVRDSTEPHSLF